MSKSTIVLLSAVFSVLFLFVASSSFVLAVDSSSVLPGSESFTFGVFDTSELRDIPLNKGTGSLSFNSPVLFSRLLLNIPYWESTHLTGHLKLLANIFYNNNNAVAIDNKYLYSFAYTDNYITTKVSYPDDKTVLPLYWRAGFIDVVNTNIESSHTNWDRTTTSANIIVLKPSNSLIQKQVSISDAVLDVGKIATSADFSSHVAVVKTPPFNDKVLLWLEDKNEISAQAQSGNFRYWVNETFYPDDKSSPSNPIPALNSISNPADNIHIYACLDANRDGKCDFLTAPDYNEPACSAESVQGDFKNSLILTGNACCGNSAECGKVETDNAGKKWLCDRKAVSLAGESPWIWRSVDSAKGGTVYDSACFDSKLLITGDSSPPSPASSPVSSSASPASSPDKSILSCGVDDGSRWFKYELAVKGADDFSPDSLKVSRESFVDKASSVEKPVLDLSDGKFTEWLTSQKSDTGVLKGIIKVKFIVKSFNPKVAVSFKPKSEGIVQISEDSSAKIYAWIVDAPLQITAPADVSFSLTTSSAPLSPTSIFVPPSSADKNCRSLKVTAQAVKSLSPSMINLAAVKYSDDTSKIFVENKDICASASSNCDWSANFPVPFDKSIQSVEIGQSLLTSLTVICSKSDDSLFVAPAEVSSSEPFKSFETAFVSKTSAGITSSHAFSCTPKIDGSGIVEIAECLSGSSSSSLPNTVKTISEGEFIQPSLLYNFSNKLNMLEVKKLSSANINLSVGTVKGEFKLSTQDDSQPRIFFLYEIDDSHKISLMRKTTNNQRELVCSITNGNSVQEFKKIIDWKVGEVHSFEVQWDKNANVNANVFKCSLDRSVFGTGSYASLSGDGSLYVNGYINSVVNGVSVFQSGGELQFSSYNSLIPLDDISFCAKDPTTPQNSIFVKELDNPQYSSACTASGAKWTGTRCCGEANDVNEFYDDPIPVVSNPAPTVSASTVPAPTVSASTAGSTSTVGICWNSTLITNDVSPPNLSSGNLNSNDLFKQFLSVNGSLLKCASSSVSRPADVLQLVNSVVNARTGNRDIFSTESNLACPAKVYSSGSSLSSKVCDFISGKWLTGDELHAQMASIASNIPDSNSNVPFVDMTKVVGKSNQKLFDSASSPPPSPPPSLACCNSDQCWNGSSCLVAGSSVDNPFVSGQKYFCGADGSWSLRVPARSWFNGEIGYCPQSSQCFVTSASGNPSSNNKPLEFYDTNNNIPQCISTGQFIGDNLCFNSVWSSRTAELAGTLVASAGTNEYELFCDSLDKVKNTGLVPTDIGWSESFNNICKPFDLENDVAGNDASCVEKACVIKVSDISGASGVSSASSWSAVGFVLNVPANNSLQGVFKKAFNLSPASCNNVVDNLDVPSTVSDAKFHQCSLGSLTYSNPSTSVPTTSVPTSSAIADSNLLWYNPARLLLIRTNVQKAGIFDTIVPSDASSAFLTKVNSVFAETKTVKLFGDVGTVYPNLDFLATSNAFNFAFHVVSKSSKELWSVIQQFYELALNSNGNGNSNDNSFTKFSVFVQKEKLPSSIASQPTSSSTSPPASTSSSSAICSQLSYLSDGSVKCVSDSSGNTFIGKKIISTSQSSDKLISDWRDITAKVRIE